MTYELISSFPEYTQCVERLTCYISNALQLTLWFFFEC